MTLIDVERRLESAYQAIGDRVATLLQNPWIIPPTLKLKPMQSPLNLTTVDYLELGRSFVQLTTTTTALDFGDPEFGTKLSGKKSQCKKGFSCGLSCVSKAKTCKSPLAGQAKTYADWLKMQIAAGVKLRGDAQTDAIKQGLLNNPVSVNQQGLDDTRAALVKKHGAKTVQAAEQNVQRILNDDNTGIFIRVGATDTLEKILGDRFMNSVELGSRQHNIPHLRDDYLTARKRVETNSMGIPDTVDPADRPIYGYFANSDVTAQSHQTPSRIYGSITVKLKNEVKDRATVTGADSFKSGMASTFMNNGTPPPPNAAALVSTTRHGYDRTKLPSHYPYHYGSDAGDSGQLKGAAKAKGIDDLAGHLAITGNAYVEAQVHGRATAKDIAEIHFNPRSASDRPSDAVLKWAKENDVKVFLNGKEVKPQKTLFQKKGATPPPKPRDLHDDLRDAITAADGAKILDLADQLAKRAKSNKLGSSSDQITHHLADMAGFTGKPKVGTIHDVTGVWQAGGTLLLRGMDNGATTAKDKFDSLQTGDYYVGGVGSNMYGSGYYCAHAGKTQHGGTTYQPFAGSLQAARSDAQNAFDTLATRHNYISSTSYNARMALPASAKLVLQADIVKEYKRVSKALDDYLSTERKKIEANATVVGAGALPAYQASVQTATDNIRLTYKAKPKLAMVSSSISWGATPTKPSDPGAVSELTLQPATKGGAPRVMDVKIERGTIGVNYFLLDKNGKGIQGLPESPNSGNWYGSQKEILEAAMKWQAHFDATGSTDVSYAPSPGTIDPASKAAIAKLEKQVDAARNTILGDAASDKVSGRLAIIQGYDGIVLNDSYEPDRYFNLLNRSIVTIQQDSLPYNSKTTAIAGF